MSYDPQETLTAPARARSHPLRLLAGMGMMVVLYVLLTIPFAELGRVLLGPGLDAETQPGGSTPLAVLFILSSFACLIIALMITMQMVHERPAATLVGPASLATWQFLRVGLFLLPLYLFLTVLPMPEEYQLSRNLALGQWLLWLPLALPCLMIQVGAEELVFRGYLQSQLAARFRHPLIWIGLPSALFGLVHYSSEPAGENAWLLVIWATLFGAAAADLTARSGTLGPALALHFANNAFAILITAPIGNMDGLALYSFPLALDDAALAWYILPLEILFTLCAWLTARLTLRV